jgi:hypothetical protein
VTTTRSAGRRARRPVGLALLLWLGAMATGCGSGASESEQDRVRRIVNGWEASLTRGDGEAACSGLSGAGRAELLLLRGGAGGIPIDASCPETVRWMLRGSRGTGSEPKPPRVVSVRVNGNRAVAQVSSGGFRPAPVRLVRQDDEWKISSPGFGSPLPAGFRGRRWGT